MAKKTKSLYKKKFEKHGDSPKSLLWKSKGAAHQRFRQFWAEIDFDNRSVLDIGCGFGEMGKFLVKRYENVDYKGIDITREFVEKGKEKYPKLDLEVADFFEFEPKDKYDIVLASGVLNSNVAGNMDFRKKALKRMFELSGKVLAFNMLGAHPAPANSPKSNVWYADSLEVLEYCMHLTRRVVFRANYHPKDFTIFMYRTAGKTKPSV